MAYENYTIKEFEDAMFKGKRDVISDEEYNIVYSEYIDTAKLYESEEFNKVSKIHYLNNRINSISIGIRLQREFIDNFEIPFIPDFERFKKLGHVLYWKNDKEQFLKALSRIEIKEKKFVSEVENDIKLLIEFRAKKNSKELPVKIKRESWIRTINSLGKIGYKIDKFKNTVEELSLMILQQIEEQKRS